MKTLKIGIIGAGAIVRQRHLPGLRKIPGIEIAAVANSTLASAQAFCVEYAPEARPYAQWEEVAVLPDLDVIWIGATPHLHEPATLAALKAGKHVFCQARMATTLLQAEEMLAAAEDRPDLVTMLCPPPHGLSVDAFMKELLAKEIVGPVNVVRLQSFNDAFLDPSKPAHWRQRKELSGDNILTLGIHAEVIQRWLGNFQVTAAQGKVFTPVRDGYQVSIPDALQVLGEFDNGAIGALEFSAVHPGEAVEQLHIIGSEGVLLYDYVKDEIRLHSRTENSWQVLPVPLGIFRSWTVEADFINAVRNPAAPRPHPNFQDGVAYMRVVEEVASLL